MRADATERTVCPVQVARLNAHFSRRINENARVGYIAMLSRQGMLVHAGAYGWRDRDARTPMTLDTRFRIASLTKPIVSAAMMAAIERGYVRLNTPVAALLPEFAEMRVGVALGADGKLETVPAVRLITVFDLMSHMAGLGAGGRTDYPAAGVYAQRYSEYFALGSVAEASAWIASLPLVFQPGAAWGYSFSVDVIARLLEVAFGEPIEEILRRLILDPLEMHDTFYNGASADRERLAAIYARNGAAEWGEVKDLALDGLKFAMSGGGLISTGADYLRFLEMTLGGGERAGVRVLSPASVAAMTRNVLPLEMRPIRLELDMMGAGFGLGFGVMPDDAPVHSLMAPGDYFWAGATDTFAFASPRRGIAALVFSQIWPNEYLRDWDTMYDFANMASAAA